MSTVVAEAGAVRPESLDAFRQGRLLLLLATLSRSPSSASTDIERLGFYDFFAANPFLVPVDVSDRSGLTIAGFDESNLSYQSAGQRFANNRARLQFDLAVLAARGLATVTVSNKRVSYGANETGRALAGQMHSLYARAYLRSAELILQHLQRLSDTALRGSARTWLKAEALLIDLYGPESVNQ